MKLENTDKYNAQVILRAAPGKVIKHKHADLWFITANVPPDATLEDLQATLEEVPATSIPRTATRLEYEVALTNEVLALVGDERRVSAGTLETFKTEATSGGQIRTKV